MRRRVAGVDQVDDAILEYFELIGHPEDSPVWLKPGIVWYNVVETRGIIDKGHTTIVRHMQKLAEAELLETDPEESGYYAITDQGLRYINNALNDEEREQISERLQ